jgi:transcriptional regulator with PAS, ATPase and Fis domain
VRELWNLVESLAVTVSTEVIEPTDLPDHIAGTLEASPASAPRKHENRKLREALRSTETQILREALKRYGTQSEAARHLGVAQATIARKAKRYGIGA